MEFKHRIKLLREEKGLSPSKLGADMDKSEGAVRSWESGKAFPDCNTLIKLAEYFSCTTDYLLGQSELRNGYEFGELQDVARIFTANILGINVEVKDKFLECIDYLFATYDAIGSNEPMQRKIWTHLNCIMGIISIASIFNDPIRSKNNENEIIVRLTDSKTNCIYRIDEIFNAIFSNIKPDYEKPHYTEIPTQMTNAFTRQLERMSKKGQSSSE